MNVEFSAAANVNGVERERGDTDVSDAVTR